MWVGRGNAVGARGNAVGVKGSMGVVGAWRGQRTVITILVDFALSKISNNQQMWRHFLLLSCLASGTVDLV